MFRTLTVLATFAALAAAPVAIAQEDTEKPWRIQVELALQAAGKKDYPAAEQAFQRALKEAQRFGPEDRRVGSTLNGLGLVYRAEKKYGEAEAAYRRALIIMQTLYVDTIDVGNMNFNIANVMFDEGHQAEALPNIQKALEIYERLFGATGLKTATVLCMEGDAWRLMKHYTEAEAPLRRCADIREKDSGIEGNNDLADALHSLALTQIAEGKFSAAEPRLKLAEKIREKTLGITSPLLAQTMEDHVAVLKELGRERDAEKLASIAAAIRRSQKGK